MVRHTIVWLAAASVLSSPALAQAQVYEPVFEGSYAPVDLTNYPNEVQQAHPAQQLTIFHPRLPPTQPNGLYPTLVYSPAGCFMEAESVGSWEAGFGEFLPLTQIVGPDPGGGGLPPLSGGRHGGAHVGSLSPGAPALAASAVQLKGFLAKALDAGWAVVTVGSTGINSWPTCKQPQDCTSDEACNMGFFPEPNCSPPLPPRPPGCRDTNLWYSPAGAEWNDFNRFWGEKDFTWARQWIALNGAAHLLDNDRIVVSGSSTGAIYAAFLAFGPNRAWDATHSLQFQQDTRVAGIVAFEPNTWVKAMPAATPAPHWPSSTNPMLINCGVTSSGCFPAEEACYNRRAGWTGAGVARVPVGLLEQSSVSRWVRQIEPTERLTPALIATSYINPIGSGFAHNANLMPFQNDYARYSGQPGYQGLIIDDPLLEYSSVNLHDTWYAITFERDLNMLNAAFHNLHSRLLLQENTQWGFLPASLSKTGSAPAKWDDVIGLDGVFPDEGVECVENISLALQVICWMNSTVGLGSEGIVPRNPLLVGGVMNKNESVYTSPTVRVGLATSVEVDLRVPSLSEYEVATVLIFDSPYLPGLMLSGGQTLLCDIGTFLFSLPFTLKDPSGPEAGIVHLTLGAAAPAGLQFYTQAIVVDAQHLMPFALTNAVDITVQACP